MSRTVKPGAVNTSKAGINGGGNPYNNLAVAVIIQAIQDWRLFSEVYSPGGSTRSRFDLAGVSLEEIESFFLSRWCEDLLSKTNLNGDWILRRLKDENNKKWPSSDGGGAVTKGPLNKHKQETRAKYQAMREMWAQGYSDTAIAGAVGVAKHTVECWRSVHSLPTNWAGIVDKLSEEEVEQRRRTP